MAAGLRYLYFVLIKKIAFIALVVAAIACGTWGYFYLQDLKKPTLKPLDVLPDSCSMLIEIKDPAHFASQLTEGNVMWEEILKIVDVQRFSTVLLALDTIANDESTRDFLGKESFYIALYGKSNSAVYAFDLSDVNEMGRATAFFEAKFAAKKIRADLYECTLKTDKVSVFYLYTHSGLILASLDKMILETISSSVTTRSLAGNENFIASYKTAAKDKEIDVFVHFPFFRSHLWGSFFAAEQKKKNNDEKWIPIDVDIQPSDLNLHGFLPVDSLQVSLAIRNQEAHDLKELYEQLPYNTFMLEAVCVNDYGAFCRDNYRGDRIARRADLKPYSDSLAASAQTEINGFIGNSIARIKAVLSDSSSELGVVALSDPGRARKFFRAVCDSSVMNSDSANLFLCDKKMFTLLAAGFFKNTFSHVSVMNDVAVFANSARVLGEYRRTVSERTNFSENERAIHFLEKDFSSDLNYLFYSDVYKDRQGILAGLSASMRGKLNEAPDLFEKFAAIGLSLQNLKEGIFYKAQASFNPRNKTYRGTLWETLIDTALYKIPDPMINHKTGESELLCQDRSNNVYLLSSTGKILWKKNVQEKILGEVKQIDFFANGKLQMIFATAGAIHLIDRNGNYVEGFPVKIKAGASGGISVFDYDGSHNYRIWLPLQNNTVICLNNNCKAVEGFVPIAIEAPLARPVQHLILQQKDYFVLTDTLGNIYAVNRKGEPRLSFKNRVGAQSDPIYLDIGKDATKTKLWYVDKESKELRGISLDDKQENHPLKFEEIKGYFFDTLQQATSPQLVLRNNEKLEVTDLSGKSVQSLEWKENCSENGSALLFGERKVYACIGKENGALHLFDLKTQKEIDNEIRLNSVPGSYDLIRSQGKYLVGFYRNKIFCLRP